MSFWSVTKSILQFIFVAPYQKVSPYNPFEKKRQFVQKWRGHHPSIDTDAANVAYEEAQIIGTVCSYAFGGRIQ